MKNRKIRMNGAILNLQEYRRYYQNDEIGCGSEREKLWLDDIQLRT